MTSCIERPLIARHFVGALAPRDERTLRAHLPTCDPCRRLYERHMILSQLDPEALGPEERIARGLGLGDAPGRRWLLAGAAGVTVAAAAAAVLLFTRPPHDDGFAARGTPASTLAAESRVFIYDLQSAPRLLHAGDSFGRHDELALAYENGAAKSRLMVFGVDEHRHVYWFYPAWTREADDPVAVPLAADDHRHELPDAVRHAFDGNTLEVHAIFSDAAFSVRQVEGIVSKQASGPLALPGAIDETTSLAIAP